MRMHPAQAKIAKHPPQAFSKVLLNLPDNGIGLSAIRTLVTAVLLLNGLLRISPFLSLNAPETKQTHHFLDAKAIACLPRGAIVVNAASDGMAVDENLIAALKSGQVAAAGLDTYEGEPKLNPGYLSLKNTFLLPHIGAATIETRTAMGMLALDNIDAVLGGRPAP